MPSYSFLDTQFTLSGPGAVAINLGAGAAVAEEGCTIAKTEDKNVMTIGADGKGQHSLIASEAAKWTFRFLKTSPINAQLMLLYNLQSSSSALWGKNVLTMRNTASGDAGGGQLCAFSKTPDLTYAKEGGIVEWVFDSINTTLILGAGNQ